MRFVWDEEKADANRRKHGLSFEEARQLFSGDADYLEIFDEAHSTYEDRFLAIGPIIERGVIVVVFAETEDETVRIISARKATRRETELYTEHFEGRRTWTRPRS